MGDKTNQEILNLSKEGLLYIHVLKCNVVLKDIVQSFSICILILITIFFFFFFVVNDCMMLIFDTDMYAVPSLLDSQVVCGLKKRKDF